MGQTIVAARSATADQLKDAVHQHSATSLGGILERLFSFAFQGLVYPQIWEDPEVDMEAMELTEDHRLASIASGGCNILSYLVKRPRSIVAIDLNPAHLALTRLKLAAAQHLPCHEAFHRFFAEARSPHNPAVYAAYLRPRLDGVTRAYWEARTLGGRRRIDLFATNFYRHGLLGRFVGAAHWLARLHAVRPEAVLAASSFEEQRSIFEREIAPIFQRRLVRWLTGRRLSLFGLGIPPAQYAKLAGDRHMADVLSDRLRRLACDFPVADNYFAWQAFARRYAEGEAAALPPYLRRECFAAIRDGSPRVETALASFTGYLRGQPAASIDRYVLLDAQDWMSDHQLNALWTEITRTAKPGARVIFRTAGETTILPGRLRASLLRQWIYHERRSAELLARDRSAIYGGFHLYSLRAFQ